MDKLDLDWKIRSAIEDAYDHLFDKFDTIAWEAQLNSKEMLEAVKRNLSWLGDADDTIDAYKDWMADGWDIDE